MHFLLNDLQKLFIDFTEIVLCMPVLPVKTVEKPKTVKFLPRKLFPRYYVFAPPQLTRALEPPVG